MKVSKEQLDRYIVELGKFTLAWSTVEFALSGWVNAIYLHHPFTGMDSSQPTAMRRKLEFLKLAHNKNASFRGHKKQAATWISEINGIKDDRHWVMKGIVSLALSDADRLMLKRLDLGPQTGKIIQKPITLGRLTAMRTKAFSLGGAIMRHAATLVPSDMP
ncbi:MAG TPA: hypothetical protein VMS78_15360 [Rhizomicrobium sp.]|nr:hypothetical protein [Rhizomicrobium sp.]